MGTNYDLFEKAMIGEIAHSVIEKKKLEKKYEEFKISVVEYVNKKLSQNAKTKNQEGQDEKS